MAVANVVARFTADISDVQSKMQTLQGSLAATTSDIEGLSTKMQAVGSSMSSLGKGMTVGLTLPIAAMGAASAKLAMDFDTSMTKIVSLVGIASDEVAGMREGVLALSGETGKSANELAEALFVVTSAGLRGNDAMNALESAAKAGAAGLGETNDIARSVAGAMNAYGPAVLDAARATDIIVATARAGNFETSQFAGALGRVLPFAKQAGASLEDVGGSVALLTRTNGDAAQSVTQVQALLRAFVVPTEEAKKVLDDLGISAGTMRDRIQKDGLAKALQTLDGELGGNREALGKLLGSSEAAAAAFQILDADAQTLTDTFGVVQDSVGMTGEAFDATAETAGFKMQQAITSLQNTMIQLGDVILPIVAAVADKVAVLAGAFSALPGPVKTAVVIFGAVVAAMGPVLWIGGKIITTMAALSGAFTAMSVRVRGAVASVVASVRTMEIQVKTAMISAQTRMGALGAGARVMGATVAAGFRTIGAAAKGAVASFGPIGLALVGITVAYEAFSGSNAEAEQAVDALTEALKEQQGVITEGFVKEVVASASAMDGFEENVRALGFTMDEVVTAVLSGDEAMTVLIDKMVTVGNADPFSGLHQTALDATGSVRDLKDIVDEASDGYARSAKDLDTVASVTSNLGIETEIAADSVDGLTGEFASQVPVIDDVKQGIQKISDMFIEFDANIAAIRAKDEFRGALADIDEAIAKNNRSLTGNGEAAMKNREAVLEAFTLAKQDAEAWGAANGKTAEQVERRFQKNTERLRETLDQQGFSQAEIEAFFGKKYVNAAGVSVGSAMVNEQVSIADRVGTAAFQAFKGVGTDIGMGTAAGIAKSVANVEVEARRLVSQAEAAARTKAESNSPSKLFARVGNDLTEGVAVGMREKQPTVNQAMRAMVQSLKDNGFTPEDVQYFTDSAKELTASLAEVLKGDKDKITEASREAFVDWYDRIKGDLQENINEAKQTFRDFAKSVSSTIMGALNFGTAQSDAAARVKAIEDAQKAVTEATAKANAEGATDADRKALVDATADLDFAKWQGEMLGTSFLDGLKAQAAQAVLFAERVKQLIQMGLSEAAIEQVLAAGAVAGTAIADELILGGQTAIDETNALVSSTQTAADEVGLLAAKNFKQAGIDTAEAMKKAFVDQFGPDGPARKRLMALMDNLSKAMDREATITVTTVHKTVYESVGSMPGRALGGPVSARTAYVVGERGPEVFVPAGAGNIIPNNALMSPVTNIPITSPMGGVSRAGATVNINVSAGMGTDPVEVGRQVVEAIRKYERRSGPVFVSA